MVAVQSRRQLLEREDAFYALLQDDTIRGETARLAPPNDTVEAAVRAGNTEQAAALLGAGADVDPLAAGWHHLSGLQLLPPGRFLAEDGNLLDLTIDRGDEALFDLLVAHGLDPVLRQERAKSGVRARSALRERVLRAAWRGHRGILDRLIAASTALAEPVGLDDPLLALAAAGHEGLYDALRLRAEPRMIHAAAALGRTEEIRALLADHPSDAFYKDVRCGASPLAWAVLFGRFETVKLLLELGADPNEQISRAIGFAIWEGAIGTEMPSRSGEHESLLSTAVRKESWPVARQLMEAGAWVDKSALKALMRSSSTFGGDLLRSAAEADKVLTEPQDWAFEAIRGLMGWGLPEGVGAERLHTLLDLGASTSFINAQGEAVIPTTVWRPANPEIVPMLRAAGAAVPPAAVVAYGFPTTPTSQRWLQQLGEAEVKELLHGVGTFQGSDPTRRILDARPDLSDEVIVYGIRLAAGKGRLDLLDLLNARAPERYDYLLDGRVIGSGARHPHFVSVLLARGADPNARQLEGPSAMFTAAMAGRPESIRMLLAAGASPDRRSDSGLTPLSIMYATVDKARQPEREDEVAECIRLLLEAGADPVAVDDVGRVAFQRLLRNASTSSMRAKIRTALEPYMDD